MKPDAPELPLVAVVGPTGSGKSGIALDLAEAFDGEIVNCDSLQVYRHFDIGTAKLPVGERRGIPHHLIDIANPDELFTAGEYARMARETLAAISRRGKLPILAGGTGFYLRALLDGLFQGPARDQPLRDRLAKRESRRPGSLHRLLTRFDSGAARRIHANDVPKVTRALEVCLLTRRPVTELFRGGRDALCGYRTLKLGLLPDRDELYSRLDVRCAQMFEAGLVDEVRHILSLGFAATCKPFESHGYKQALQQIQGTWFRREPGLVWLKGFGDAAEIRQTAVERVRSYLTLVGDF
jgi:tRNA dimethylallyltransferase